MPRYFFDVRDEDSLSRDETGLELESFDSARTEALRALSELVREALPQTDRTFIAIDIRDAPRGRLLASVAVSSSLLWDLGEEPDAGGSAAPRSH